MLSLVLVHQNLIVMKRLLQDYLTFNKADRNGIVVLLCFIFSLLIFFNLMEHFSPKETIDFSGFESSMHKLEENKAELIKQRKDFRAMGPGSSISNPSADQPYQSQPLESFNPNHATKEQWLTLGLNEKQIKTIFNFEAKGGSFKTVDDVKKIYGISETLFESIRHHLNLPSIHGKDAEWAKSAHAKTTPGNFKKMKSGPSPIELNTSDTAMLIQLKGIGPGFARRILKYRERLGGFVSIEQLYEVWGLDSSIVAALTPFLRVDENLVRKIPINHCTVSELKKHPYMNYNIANNIVQYRDRHGNYSRIEDIKQAVLVNEELFRKIAPYLTLE